MDKETRGAIERATQRGRRLLEEDFASQVEGTFDVLGDGTIAAGGGAHLNPRQVFQRDKIVAAIEHKRAAGMSAASAVADYLRDAAFTTLNRFVALKMLEARELVRPCITKGEQSAGYREFCGLSPGVALLPDSAGYRLYIESLFDELSTEVKVLFDRRDPASVLWPKRATFEGLLTVLNSADLASVWSEDETIGWVYQFFNSGDERKRMREESLAPRNSRELAVRNQFFTPRYVVEFLVDNTLGRTWLEMQGDSSGLTERCRYFVRSGDKHVRARPRKDPRDLRILDPSCGSGHFLLYCFDLLLTIYEEAWAAEGSDPRSDATDRTLRDDYPDLETLRRAIPGLILDHNLHGVDIDPRTAQIAALALWLRAQRALQAFGVPAAERQRVRRTHVVVAEPIAGEHSLVEEFAARLDPPFLRDLFRKMVSEMRLAGELGALILVEEGIAAEVRRARDQFVAQRHATGFLPGLAPVHKQGELDISGINDDTFFLEAEATIAETLRRFVEAATGGANTRRRLFADDAAHGIALMDLLRKRFDVVLMNPPFGDCSLGAKEAFDNSYPRTKTDLYTAFVERGIALLSSRGLLGAITSRTGFSLPTFQTWRQEIVLQTAPPVVVGDLGYGVLDSALVEVAAYCLEKGREPHLPTVFFRTLDDVDKAAALGMAIREPDAANGTRRFEVDPAVFSSVPGSPFAYWVSPRILKLFENPEWKEVVRPVAKNGLGTLGDFRFVRLAIEVSTRMGGESAGTYFPMCNGGRHSPYYQDVSACVNWQRNGVEVKAHIEHAYGGSHWSRSARSVDYYFRPGFTWPVRGVRFCAQAVPAGCVFSVAGKMAFVRPDMLPAFHGLMNSSMFAFLVRVQSDAVRIQFQGGLVEGVPIPLLPTAAEKSLGALARQAWSLKRSLDTTTETSHAFTLPALLQVEGDTPTVRASAWTQQTRAVEAKVASLQREVDDLCFDLYGVEDVDRHAITQLMGGGGEKSPGDTDLEGQDSDVESGEPDGTDHAADLVSWAVAVAVGRFDIRLAIGERQLPVDAEPFDPLPIRAPGWLISDDPEDGFSQEYPLAVPRNGRLVDDPGHPEDVTAAVRKVYDVVFGEGVADRWWNDLAAMLDPKGHDLRLWLATRFFEHHLKRYSRSRRKAPILWQLGTPSTKYSVWLYAHRLTRDTFFQLQNDVVGPKVTQEEGQLTRLIQNAAGGPSSAERKEIAAQEALVEELRAMLDEVKRVAPLWNPSLDDGVVLTMAPLWRLVPQYRPWQKELKSKWDELAGGKYDWAHLAMHLWPERVVPKCSTDRSLAVAHGLENEFWIEVTDGKWQPRATPVRTLEHLIRERTSPAVKAALKSLLEAPVAGGSNRASGRRATSAAATERGGSS